MARQRHFFSRLPTRSSLPKPDCQYTNPLRVAASRAIVCGFQNRSTDRTNAAQELQKLGGAKVILTSARNAKAMSEIFTGLGRRGKPSASEDTLRFAALTGIRPTIEKFPWKGPPMPTHA